MISFSKNTLMPCDFNIAYVNDKTPGIYTLNRNYAAYEIEAVGAGVDFTLYDESTVRRLVVERPSLMPYYPAAKALKRGIDLEYGKKQITASVTSGILMGTSTRKIAADLRKRIVTMSVESALRAARTAVTAAENGGRQASYERAAEMGVEMTREWLAVHDARTRHAHGMADGQRVGVDEPFIVGGEELMFPGDTSRGASGWNIYNCRCSLVPAVKGHERKRETYSEWLARKMEEDPEGTTLEFKKVARASADRKQWKEYRAIVGNAVPNSLDKFQEWKYTNPDEWNFVKAFAKERKKGNINSTVSLEKLHEVYDNAVELFVGQSTSNGIEIKSVSVHFAARVIGNPDANRKGVSLESCLEAITAPVRVDPPCEKDGKTIQRFWTIGTTVTVNPEIGKVVQCNPNHRKRR